MAVRKKCASKSTRKAGSKKAAGKKEESKKKSAKKIGKKKKSAAKKRGGSRGAKRSMSTGTKKKSSKERASKPGTKDYRAKDITVLEGLEPVRKRPAMYIGGVDYKGLHHLLWEILDNSIDEAINGFANAIELELAKDLGGARITDNGRGIPVDKHPTHKKSALELILTTLHAGGKFGQDNYIHSGGLHGVGASVVNALASKMVATVKRDGKEYTQSFKRGKPTGPLKKAGKARGSGTSIYLQPDAKIFSKTSFDPKLVREVVEAKSYLHRGLKITLKDRANKTVETFEHSEGIQDFLKKIVSDRGKKPTEDFVFYTQKDSEPRMEVALQWTDETAEYIQSYVNGIRTPMGGTHDNGLKAGVVKAVRNYMDTHNLQPKGVSVTAEDVREGFTAVLSAFLSNPQFQGQTKDRLNNPEINALVNGAVSPALEQFFNENGAIAKNVVGRVVLAARARAASRAAAESVVRKSSVSHRLNLPGKLADCESTRPHVSEIFIVEGDSAGGSAKQARDRKHQAILPLRGKVLNTEQATMSKVVANKEIADIVSALGCGLGPKFDASKLRYGRVIILTDADSDGHHIATLLLTFFYRHLPDLVRGGHVYLGLPPLYRAEMGKETYWAWSDRDLERKIKAHKGNARAAVPRAQPAHAPQCAAASSTQRT